MIRGAEFLIIVVYLIPAALAIVDAVRIGESRWQASGQNQVVWVVVILLAPLLGPILYFVLARPRLRAP